MRKILILLSCFGAFLNYNLYAQTNTFPATGNVGVGTLSPSYKLEVNAGSSYSYGTAMFRNDVGYLVIGAMNQHYAHIYTDRPAFAFDKEIVLVQNPSRIKAYLSNPLHLNAGDVDRLTILSTGNVGIGTTSPVTKLHAVDPSNFFSAAFSGGVNGNLVAIGCIANVPSINGYSNGFGATMNLALQVQGGNVGIGTSTPTNKLEVNGTIKTKEVNVTTAGWPDYVFAADYNLMPLDSLSEFIKTNSHLPGVPSESEVNLNGANLGEMNVILLKKIEELTLYLLLQAKEIEALKTKLDL